MDFILWTFWINTGFHDENG